MQIKTSHVSSHLSFELADWARWRRSLDRFQMNWFCVKLLMPLSASQGLIVSKGFNSVAGLKSSAKVPTTLYPLDPYFFQSYWLSTGSSTSKCLGHNTYSLSTNHCQPLTSLLTFHVSSCGYSITNTSFSPTLYSTSLCVSSQQLHDHSSFHVDITTNRHPPHSHVNDNNYLRWFPRPALQDSLSDPEIRCHSKRYSQ